MLKSEILEFVSQGEGAKLEFKRDDVRPEQLAKVIVSFANMNGGHILLGVEDDRTISGVVWRENLQAWVMDAVIGRHVHPPVIPDYEEISIPVEDGKEGKKENKKIAVLTVPMGTAKPYALKHSDRLDIYVRFGDTCQLASREQQARLFQAGGMVKAEEFPVHGSTVTELDKRRYREYFVDILGEEEKILDLDDFLVNRSFLVEIEKGESRCCSYFAHILFAKGPRRRLPQAGLRLLIYPGTEADYDANLDEVLDMPFLGLEEKNLEEFVEPSLPNRVLGYLQAHISREGLEGMRRKRHWDYPPEVIRELIANAFAHRDWTRQKDIRLTVFSDRMEIESPGALPNGMTLDKVRAGQQMSRNANIVRILRDYGFVDDRGMGIRRKVIPLMREHNNSEPDFEATEDYLKVVLWKR